MPDIGEQIGLPNAMIITDSGFVGISGLCKSAFGTKTVNVHLGIDVADIVAPIIVNFLLECQFYASRFLISNVDKLILPSFTYSHGFYRIIQIDVEQIYVHASFGAEVMFDTQNFGMPFLRTQISIAF